MPSPRRPIAPAADCRCACGSLVAKLVHAGVELKCRRCKRILVVPLTPADPAAQAPGRPEPLWRSG
jgi:hypothetical protein